MDSQLLSLLAALGLLCIAIAAFATDWRLGLALVGVALLVIAVRLQMAADNCEAPL